MQPFIYEGIVAMVQGGCSLAEQNQRGTNWSNSGKFLQKKNKWENLFGNWFNSAHVTHVNVRVV